MTGYILIVLISFYPVLYYFEYKFNKFSIKYDLISSLQSVWFTIYSTVNSLYYQMFDIFSFPIINSIILQIV
jgi:hypothetical protein